MADKKTGYISLWRSFLKWEWYDDINTKTLFLHCLLNANYKENNWHGITIKKGQFVTSLRKLSMDTGLSLQNVRTALSNLVSTHEITQQGTSKYTIITVKNWSKYQEGNTQTNKQLTHDQHTGNTRVTTTNKENNINNSNKGNNKHTMSFETFWKIYPKKTGKKTAQASFEKALNSGTSASVIIKALQKVVDLRWSKYPEEEKRYIPNPTTWLNQERWNDEVDSYVQKKKSNKQVKELPGFLKDKKVNLEDLPF